MEKWFIDRGHKPSTVKLARSKATNTTRQQALTYKQNTSNNRTPIVINHHPSNPPIRKWLVELTTNVLHGSTRMTEAMPDPPVLGERNTKNLRNLLMPSILPTPPDNQPGCYKCNKKCTICSNHLVETTTFHSMQSKDTFTIRHALSCQSSNIIYVLYCDMCNNSQYVGETKNTLKTRFYQHRSNINKNTGTLVTKHFNQPTHRLDNMKCIAIEKVFHDSLEARLTREEFWMKKLKTNSPLGLNTL